jgi:DNA-binding MarR family transcriptional regulator
MKAEEQYAAAVEIRILAAIINKLSMRDLELRLDTCKAGVTGPQYGLLRFLKHHGGTISEMSRKMMLAPATLVPVVDALEQKGLVERGKDPQDRRRTPLLLTADGLETLERMPVVDSADSLVHSLAAMGDVKTETLAALLQELAKHMSGHDEAAWDNKHALRRRIGSPGAAD